ncbi:MerR family DNA-binding transcriptional regulator [Actinomadura harenae]|uniref:MerR family DNA-binding transcriptional regulator n=1 Tax=Actinomadura harenae TaxID=2483351 RepID=A0A3M2LF33_9ACTN|nr:MerR family DNA-binding transcriptional regulator [Actinomadura harenae]RMI36149.1 MerR family DNA-binding transcriptional regulator [Actinomadura harenae]
MLIGELAKRTGVSGRLLRYYEEQGLIASRRLPNGYRDYEDGVAETVLQVRALLAAGLPVRLIEQVLPCAEGDGDSGLRPCPGVLDKLRTQLDVLDRRAAEIARAREILGRTISLTEAH